jgi:dihydrolipoamide dehydrogenase
MYDLIVIGAGPGGYEVALTRRGWARRSHWSKSASAGVSQRGLHPGQDVSAVVEAVSRVHAGGGVRDTTRVSRVRHGGVVAQESSGRDADERGRRHAQEGGRRNDPARRVWWTAYGGAAMRFETANVCWRPGRGLQNPDSGIRSERVLDSDTVFELQAVPRIAIIGGGVIGLEFACFFRDRNRGQRFEMLPQIAGATDQGFPDRLLQIMRKQGVEFNFLPGLEIAAIRCIMPPPMDLRRAPADYILNDRACLPCRIWDSKISASIFLLAA